MIGLLFYGCTGRVYQGSPEKIIGRRGQQVAGHVQGLVAYPLHHPRLCEEGSQVRVRDKGETDIGGRDLTQLTCRSGQYGAG